MYPRGSLRVHGGSARRLVLAVSGLALAVGMVPALAGAGPAPRAAAATGAAAAPADDLTASSDSFRDG
jgi:uncharacterized membrane protein YfcA